MALKPYKVILGFALFVMIGMLPCFPLLNNTNGGVMLWAYSLVLSAFVLSAVWGGLGTQTYLRRTLLGSITIWGIFLGALGSIFLLQFDSTTSIDFPAAIIGLALVTMTVGGQIPFLLLNWLAGWHFSSERNSDKPSLSIQSMFTIVFVFAIAFASSQLAKQRILDAELARYVVGEETYVVDPGSAQGNGAVRGSSMKMVEVTAANIEELRRNAIKENQIESALLASLYAIVAGVLAIPILWFVFEGPTERVSSIRCFTYLDLA